MYTSYFAKAKALPNIVSISLYSPKWLPGIREYKDLAPSVYILDMYKKGLISQEEYVVLFCERLNRLDPVEVYSELGENSILCCYETISEFCHRHIVARWFQDQLGIEVKELQ